MDITRPIFWHQGLFLQPQHFQMEDLFVQSQLAPFRRFLQPHFWGVGSVEIREQALTTGVFDLFSGEFVFSDGAYVVLPGNAHFHARSFAGAWPEGETTFNVYLGVRKWNPAGDNVTVVQRLDQPTEITTRFVTTPDPEEMRDLYQPGPPAQMRRLHYACRIFWETEREELNEYELLPLAQLQRDGQEIKLSDHFVPPSLSLAASGWLDKAVKEIRDQLASRSAQLEEFKRTRSLKSGDLEVGDMVQFLGLRTLGRYVPVLQHLTETPDVHPWQVYGVIRQLVGELLAFSERHSLASELSDEGRVIPSYDHRNIHACFAKAQAAVGTLLDDIVLGGENVYHLHLADGIYSGAMPSAAFDPRNLYYLILRTERPAEWVVDSIKTVAKLGSRESIATLTTRFVGGLGLEHMSYPPAGVPRLAHAIYFRIDTENPMWEEVKDSGTIALYWDMAPKDLTAEIIVQR